MSRRARHDRVAVIPSGARIQCLRGKGAASEAVGRMKRGLGRMLRSPTLQASGDLQQARGHALTAIGRAKSIARTLTKH